MTVTVYGIKNCDTMKKTFHWLNDNNVAYEFHDYKKAPVNQNILDAAMNEYGWESVINRRGTTWRQLPDTIKDTMDRDKAIEIAHEKPSIIKRPIIANGNTILLGFDPETYKNTLI